jgi:lipoate-protein ligase A
VRWRLLITPPLPAADNMAFDDALLDRARETGETVLRVYTWAGPTLSFGRNQSVQGLYDPARLQARGIAVVRRPTGGRALLHHREVTYSVTAPVIAAESLRESYTRINRLLLDGLRRLGVTEVQAAPASRETRLDASPCFARPSHGELVVDGHKLVGSAQWRQDGALLQHGSMLIDDDQPLVAELATRPLVPPEAAATLRRALGRAPTADDVAGALFAAVRGLEDAHASGIDADVSLAAAMAQRRARYDDAAWTWRR